MKNSPSKNLRLQWGLTCAVHKHVTLILQGMQNNLYYGNLCRNAIQEE